MRKLIIAAFCVVGCLSFGVANAQTNNLNEPGSMLVWPLIDNIDHTTIVEIVNRAPNPVWLGCFMITESGEPCVYNKDDFTIHLTHNEPFWWQTDLPYNRTDADGVITQIPAFNNQIGFMFCWAIDDVTTQLEIDWDWLMGDAFLFDLATSRAWSYNAIPHQSIAVVGDRILNLDGAEYTMATSQIMWDAFAAGVAGIEGTLSVTNLDIDFILSEQPDFDVNFECWNQDEVQSSRHLDLCQSENWDLRDDLRLSLAEIFTAKYHCSTTATGALWAVVSQNAARFEWGDLVWQHPATGVAAVVVLPPPPVAP